MEVILLDWQLEKGGTLRPVDRSAQIAIALRSPLAVLAAVAVPSVLRARVRASGATRSAALAAFAAVAG